MKETNRHNPCFLGILFSFCLAAISGCSACPKLCACYVPTEVHCTFRYLAAIPSQIPQNVERINLGYNSLVKLTETDFSGLEKLELLMLHSNQIHTIQDKTFSDLPLLQVLKMSYNKVKVVQADTFQGLTGLVRLHMDHNQIEFINPKAFYGLISLKLVHLEGNLLKQLHPDTFVTLRYLQLFKTSSIKHIYLSDNLLTSLPQDIFTYMPELESLYLHGNSWTCDCALKWFAEWAKLKSEVIKCKKDRGSSGVLQCPLCANPRISKDRQLASIPLSSFKCIKPTIDLRLKLKNNTVLDDGDFTSVSARDFMAPVGTIILNFTDQAGHQANLDCNVQKPTDMTPASFKASENTTVLQVSLSTFLVCSVGSEQMQQLWTILALYSESPLKLERHLMLSEGPYVSHKYKQIDPQNEELFTGIEAELRAQPLWLLQEQVALQLDRTATTLNTLHIHYFTDAQVTVPITTSKPIRQSWIMISREINRRTEYTVLAGGTVKLDCQVLGDPAPVTNWVLADGTKVRAPYVSEDGRIVIRKSGKFILQTADNFDSGLYHCIGTNYEDADVLTFRITVLDAYVEPNHFNGPQLSASLGEALYLSCNSAGSPDASVDWILPERMLFSNSSKNRQLFQNGTLKIQRITEQDNGYFKCLAANQYGADFLVYQVKVKKNVGTLQKLDIQVEDEAAEGSGNKQHEPLAKTSNPLPIIKAQVSNQASTEPSAINHPAPNRNKKGYIYNKGKIRKRFRGHKRRFGSSARRIDPLRWTAFLEKSKHAATFLRKQENASAKPTVKPTVKVLLPSKISGNKEEASGDDVFPEEELILLVTKKPAVHTLREASGNVVTAEIGSMLSNYSYLATSGLATTTTYPVINPMNMYSETPKNEKLFTGRDSVAEVLPLPPILMESSTVLSFNLQSTFQQLRPSGENKLYLKVTPTVTPATITKSGHSITYRNTEKMNLLTKATEKISRKSNNQVSKVTVTVPDDVFKHTYVYSREKLTTPQPFSGSSIITHPQNKTIRNVKTHTLLSRLPVRRRKLSGRRRIITPDHSLNSANRKFAFPRLRLAAKSTKLSSPLDLSTPPLSPPNKYLEQITSSKPTSTSFRAHHPAATAVNRFLAASRAKLMTAEEQMTSTTMPYSPESTQMISHGEVKPITALQGIMGTNSQLSIRIPGTTTLNSDGSTETMSTKPTTSLSVVKSTLSALETNASFYVSTQETNLSHNSFRSTYVQKEHQVELLGLQSNGESSPMLSENPQTTVQILILPVDRTTVSKSENQTDGLTNPVMVKHVPVQSLSVTEVPFSTYIPSLTTIVRKSLEVPGITPIPSPSTTVQVKTEVVRMIRPGRRRGQRRRRPLKKLISSHRTININKGVAAVSKKTVASSALAMAKNISEPVHPSETGLLPNFKRESVTTARLQLPGLSTTNLIVSDKSTLTAEVLSKNTTPEINLATKMPTNNLSSEKPTVIPETVSFLDKASTTIALLTTTLVMLTPTPARSTYSIRAAEHNGLYQHVSQKKETSTETPVQIVLSPPTPINARYPIKHLLNPLATQTAIMPHTTVIQTTALPTQEEKSWHESISKIVESDKILTASPMDILKSPQSSTQYSTSWRKNKNNYLKTWSEKATDQEATTTNLIALDLFYQPRGAKPRIIGGKVAAFTVLANSDAFIPCEATGYPQPAIQWTKVSSGADALNQGHDNKLEVLPNGTLSIQNVDIKDRGQYLCVASNQHGFDRLLITLSVVTYPPRILEGKSKTITVHASKSATMKCTAKGRPPPTIVWTLANKTYVSQSSKGNEAVTMQRNGTLIIKQATVYDRGIYTCTANNPAGSDTMVIRLQVIAAPPVILEEKKQYVMENMGASLSLPCTVKGNPHPYVHWVLFDGTEVKPLQYINGKFFLFPNGTLSIRNIAPSDRGNYECIATSSTGSERRVVILQVEHKDTIPRIAASSQRLTQLNFGDRLLLNCSATGEPKPKIIWRLPSKAVIDQWHRMGSRIHVYPNGSLVIEAITEKDAGDYICVARNKLGDDLILMKVSVTMKPAKIDQKSYFKKLVPYGKDFRVDCKASGLPEPEITWSLPDGTMINNVMQADDSGHRAQKYTLFDNGTLSFNNVGTAEEGDYTCYAQNTLGKDEMKVHITVVAAAPHIKQNAKTYTKVKAGDNALFNCESIGEPRPKIFWLLPSNNMISASTHRHFLHINGSLSITNVRLLDAGEYVCVARNSGGDDTKLYKLEVISKPPLINGLYSNKTVIKTTAIKHTKKQMDCRAEGTPIPQIMWIMPDNIFLTAPYFGSRISVYKNGTLEIRNVRSSDTAEFICVARNDGGESILVVQLEVLEMLRRPMFRNPFNEKIIAKPGKPIFLNCSVDGNPPPEIIWTLPNGTRLSDGVRTRQHSLGNNGTLVIYSPSTADTGKYRCAAKNKVGYIERLVILEIGQKPIIFIYSRGAIKTIIGQSLSLHCLAGGNPKPNIIWKVPSGYVLDRPQINGKYILLENGTLVIRDTSIQDGGSYECKAENSAGDSRVVVSVMIVAHPPRITNRPPRSIRTMAGKSIQLHCMALGIPNPEIMWELPDHSTLYIGGNGKTSGSELLHPQGTLIIQNPTLSDSGIYKCTAKNQLGRDSTVTYIQVI